MPLISRAVRLAIVNSVPEDYADLLAATGTPGVSLHFLFSGCEALNFARRWQMTLWIVNSRLCDMSGFELGQKLRSQRPNASVFIIGDEYRLADELQTMTQGLTKYLCKPLEPSWVLPREDESCIPMPASRDASLARWPESRHGHPRGDTIIEKTMANRTGPYPVKGVILPFENKSERRPAA